MTLVFTTAVAFALIPFIVACTSFLYPCNMERKNFIWLGMIGNGILFLLFFVGIFITDGLTIEAMVMSGISAIGVLDMIDDSANMVEKTVICGYDAVYDVDRSPLGRAIMFFMILFLLIFVGAIIRGQVIG